MPVIPGVVETFEKLIKLHRSKNDDYSGDNEPFYNFDFAEYIASLFKGAKDKVYVTQIAIKLARLSVVLYKSTPNNESVEDTFDDLICFGALWKANWMSRNKPQIRQITEASTIRETK
jgi:hypothetical protein